MTRRPILVGLDGSEPSSAALEWAAREALLRDTGLDILHAFPWPLLGVPLDPRRTDAWQGAERLVAQAGARAGDILPGERVHGEVVTDSAARTLIDRSADATLIVVGTRGRGGFRELLVGSVALQVAGHAVCPVVLVHAGWRPPVDAREIAVGVGTDAALAAAFAEADLRGVNLRAVRAWQPPLGGSGGLTPMVADGSIPTELDLRQYERVAEAHLTGALTPWRTRFPKVRIAESVVCDRARHVLIEISEHVELLVIGAHDQTGPHSLALGGTAHAVLHHATCPVLVARQK
jgi:nucleotide-binding universal stress UspA family protein